MKKIFTIAILAILMVMPAFGASTAELLLTAEVHSSYEIDLSTEAKTSNGKFSGAVTSVSAPQIDIDLDLIDTKTTSTYYLATRTNQKTPVEVTVSSSTLVNTAGDVMGYDIYFALPSYSNDAVNTSFTSTLVGGIGTYTYPALATKHGMKVINYPFYASITRAQYEIAEIGTYTATITFNITGA